MYDPPADSCTVEETVAPISEYSMGPMPLLSSALAEIADVDVFRHGQASVPSTEIWEIGADSVPDLPAHLRRLAKQGHDSINIAE